MPANADDEANVKLVGPFVLKVARENWLAWQDVYEYKGTIATSPLLMYEGRFASFLREYAVGRTISKGSHDKLRLELRGSRRFRQAMKDRSGQALDGLARELGLRFGSQKRKNKILSLLSKVAAFLRPERFVAWDQFGRKGLSVVLRRSSSSHFKSYPEYLAAFNALWKCSETEIRGYVARRGVRNPVEREEPFLRRVLDVYLMKRGDRWARKRLWPRTS